MILSRESCYQSKTLNFRQVPGTLSGQVGTSIRIQAVLAEIGAYASPKMLEQLWIYHYNCQILNIASVSTVIILLILCLRAIRSFTSQSEQLLIYHYNCQNLEHCKCLKRDYTTDSMPGCNQKLHLPVRHNSQDKIRCAWKTVELRDRLSPRGRLTWKHRFGNKGELDVLTTKWIGVQVGGCHLPGLDAPGPAVWTLLPADCTQMSTRILTWIIDATILDAAPPVWTLLPA